MCAVIAHCIWPPAAPSLFISFIHATQDHGDHMVWSTNKIYINKKTPLPSPGPLCAALCSRCLWRMTSAFLWLVLMSGLAMISVFLRLLLMAVEAVERANGGRRSWYSWSVKSDSGTSTAILSGDELYTST